MKKRKRHKWDAFICHATEDKKDFVTPLVKELEKYGIRVWLDEITLKIGDSIRQRIDEGLVKSRFGIVVFSPSFFEKNWSKAELDGLFAREMEGKKVILPIWHKITKEELAEKAATLALRLAAKSSEGTPAVARRLVEVIRPKALKLDQSHADAQKANTRLLEQLQQAGKNPTIDYRVVAGRGAAPSTFDLDSLEKLGVKDAIASIYYSGTRIDLVPKNLSEYAKNPLNFKIQFRDAGVEKFKTMMETGREQEFVGGEFGNVQMNLELFPSFQGPATNQRLILKPHSGKSIPVRVTFGSGSDLVVYDFMRHRIERSGTIEAAATLDGDRVPFVINLLIKRTPKFDVEMSVKPQLEGKDIRAVQKFTKVKRALWDSGRVEIFDLESSTPLLAGTISTPKASEYDIWLERLVADIAAIAEFFEIDIRWPEKITEADIELLILLKWMIEKKPYGTGARFTSVMTKTAGNANAFNGLASRASIMIPHEAPLVFLGVPIEGYTVAVQSDEAQIKDFDITKKRFEDASIGEQIEVVFEAPGVVWIKLWDRNENQPAENPSRLKAE